MKKLLALTLGLALLLSLTACNSGSDTELSGAVVPARVNFQSDDLVGELSPWITVLNQCADETFGAEVDYNNSYQALYEKKDSSEFAVLIPSEEIKDDGQGYQAAGKYKGFWIDPVWAGYYPVLNWHSVQEVKSYLSGYLGADFIKQQFLPGHQFAEYQDSLYLVRGGRGYGATFYDGDSVAFQKSQAEAYYVTIDRYLFDELDQQVTLVFEYQGGQLLITQEIE